VRKANRQETRRALKITDRRSRAVLQSVPVSWTVRVDREHGVSYVSLTGTVTFEDLAVAQRALAADPDFDPTFPALLDLRGAADVRLTPADMQSLASASALGLSTRRAILVGSPRIFAMARMYETLGSGQSTHHVVRACRTLAECAEWLGIEHLEP
jgi:hypothetical protein